MITVTDVHNHSTTNAHALSYLPPSSELRHTFEGNVLLFLIVILHLQQCEALRYSHIIPPHALCHFPAHIVTVKGLSYLSKVKTLLKPTLLLTVFTPFIIHSFILVLYNTVTECIMNIERKTYVECLI